MRMTHLRCLAARRLICSLSVAALPLAGCVAKDGKLFLLEHPGMERVDEALAAKIDNWGKKTIENGKEANLNRKKQIDEEARKQAERDAWTQIGGGCGIIALACLKLWLNRKPK